MILPWQKSASDKLDKMIQQNHLPHALLITGVDRIGKLNLTQNLIQKLLCHDSSCGKCELCQSLQKDHPEEGIGHSVLIRRSHYPNLIYCRTELNDSGFMSKEIRVDQIRAFCEVLSKTAESLQIGVIFYADQMNNNAANAPRTTTDTTIRITVRSIDEDGSPVLAAGASDVHSPNSHASSRSVLSSTRSSFASVCSVVPSVKVAR